jgi:hypothetical protein
MVVEKADERLGRVLEHCCRRRRPYGRRHGQKMIVAKRSSVFTAIEERAECLPASADLSRRISIEAAQIGEHSPERRTQSVCALSE